MTIPILIADDHSLLRARLRALLNTEPDLQVVGEAGDGHEALVLAAQLRPGVILADINMPGPSGIQVARELKRTQPTAHVLILTMYEDPDLVQEALSAGAAGFVAKRAAETDLINAIHAVARGDVYVDPKLSRVLPDRSSSWAQLEITDDELLTLEETELLKLLARGCTSREIGEALSVDMAGLDVRRAHLQAKLGLRGRVDLMRYARQRGLL